MTPKNKKWCQIGVKIEKITILEDIKDCKPLILLGLQKNNKKISTQSLTRLTAYVIPIIEQKEREVTR